MSVYFWAEVTSGPGSKTTRLRVPGGWLYRVVEWDSDSDLGRTYSVSMAFVTDVGIDDPERAEGAAAQQTSTHPVFLTPDDVARQLKLDVETVRKFIRSGRLPAVRMAGPRGRYRIDQRDIDRIIEKSGGAPCA